MNPAHAVSRPRVADTRSCEEWLSRTALADSAHACAAFVQLLDDLEDSPSGPAALVEILERLRRPMLTALEEQARRFANRALPLVATEESSFVQACDLWLALLRAWRRLQQAADKTEEFAFARPLVALRTIESAAGMIRAHFAARREITPQLWRWLHEGYLHAETHRLAENPVPGKHGDAVSCQAAYAEILLLHLAHPYGLGPRDFAWVQNWARRWGRKVLLWRSAENGGGPAVDLQGDAGPCWTAAGVPGSTLRFVDCSDVARSIRRRIKKLQQGAEPAELGLGHDCTSPAVEKLLVAMSRCWSDSQQLRQYPRRKLSAHADLALGMEAIFAAIAARPFRDEDNPWSYSRRSAEQMHIFQRAIEHERSRKQPAEQHETWETIDESANGFQLSNKAPSQRVALWQLTALRSAGTQKFILCEVRWIRQGADGSLSIGVKALPGLPEPCALRLTGDLGKARGWMPAFVLPVATGLPPTITVPAGFYGNRREAELKLDDRQMTIRFSGLLRHGHDFDWVDFSAAS